MQDQKTSQQFTSWINSATPEEAINAGKQVLTRLGTLDQTHRDRFVKEVRADPNAYRVLDDLKQPA